MILTFASAMLYQLSYRKAMDMVMDMANRIWSKDQICALRLAALDCWNDPAAEEGGLARGGGGETHSLKPLRRRRSVLDEVFGQ